MGSFWATAEGLQSCLNVDETRLIGGSTGGCEVSGETGEAPRIGADCIGELYGDDAIGETGSEEALAL